MALPKKDHRKIVVNNETYYWYVKGNEIWNEKLISVHHSSGSGQPIYIDPYTEAFEVRPGMVREAIIYALKHGWSPKVKGEPLYFGRNSKGFIKISGEHKFAYRANSGFKVTDTSLDQMKKEGIPENVINNLSRIKDQWFTEYEYENLLKSSFQKEQCTDYREKVLKYSKLGN